MSSTSANLTSDAGMEADPRFLQAVQFVLGDLSAHEQAAFEAALADDVALCELVAHAARLTHGVQLALADSDTPVVSSARTDVRRDRWLAAVVATLATGVAAGFFTTLTAPSTPASAQAAARLVSLWRDAGRTHSIAALSEAPIDAEVRDNTGDDRVPNWMLAAVSLENRPSRQPLPGNPPAEPWEDN
jgi:hypothetical protein